MTSPDPLASELQQVLTHSRVRPGMPLAQATTLAIGGPARCLVDVESEQDLERLFQVLAHRQTAWAFLGKGSNVLAPDEGVDGVVIRLGKGFAEIERCGEDLVRAGAGVSNPVFVRRCRAWGLGGMEFLTAIPGTLGGAVAMNAGAHGKETAAFLRSARVFRPATGLVEDLPAANLPFAYRHSPLSAQQGVVVLSAEFQLAAMTEQDMTQREKDIQDKRRATQPRDFPNCGSVFKNPPGDHAARLIQEAGLKGVTLGGAQVSEKHANFIVNRGGATAADVLTLVERIRAEVERRFGIGLEMEVQPLAVHPPPVIQKSQP
ncbi:MAG: UDP-N-acetylmuramate dehydrogenase [Deltaproteobacteria bacterium]|nr:UDP-N-acetylmuramate dehydrogenase [Deltaproteobacteria bacterium]